MSPGQPLMQIVDAQSIVVKAAVNQADANTLRVVAKARIQVDAHPGMSLPGHVSSIGAFAVVGTYRRSFLSEVPVQIKFDKMDDRVLPNYSASADVVIEERGNAIVIPRECVFEEPGCPKRIAFARNGDTWERREIEIGLQSNTEAEVISGLRTGEQVAAERVPAAALAAP
jgi:hypothetical protein